MSMRTCLPCGLTEKWADVEADAATFDKKVEKGKLHWEQWCGIVQLDCNWFTGHMVHGRVLAGHGSGASKMGKHVCEGTLAAYEG